MRVDDETKYTVYEANLANILYTVYEANLANILYTVYEANLANILYTVYGANLAKTTACNILKQPLVIFLNNRL